MYDKPKVMTGIVIFLVIVLFPIWFSIAGGGAGAEVDLGDVKKKTGADGCIEGTEWMRAHHMDLLDEWRDDVVRNNDRVFEFRGVRFEKSLTNTCIMKCHKGESRKTEFCDRCHDYTSVKPNCWDCHVDPEFGNEPAEGE